MMRKHDEEERFTDYYDIEDAKDILEMLIACFSLIPIVILLAAFG